MSNEKYYTPHISEFYVGFRYEKINSNGEWEKFDDFSNSYDYEDNPHYAVQKDIEHGRIRVKFLDREDIESEEWENHQDYNHWYKLKTVILAVYDIKDVRIFKDSPGELTSEYFFQGTIKSRSELRKVMEMIGITK